MARKSQPKSGKKTTRKRKKPAAAKFRRAPAKKAKRSSAAKGPPSAAKRVAQKRSAKKAKPEPTTASAKRSFTTLPKRSPQTAPKVSRESTPAQQTPRPSIRQDSAGKGKPYYITTAIAYPNGPPHIGHAYEAIATDAIARFARLDGFDVFFLTGTDEHGIKMLQTAGKEGITPRELVERNVPRFKAMVKMLNCSNDEFIRTTDERHHRASEAIWEAMEKNGDIYLDKYSGW
jgi:methionyl-tRNA synthetase